MGDTAFKTQVSRDENANTASNVLYIQLADNAGNVAGVTGGALDVNATVTLETAYVDDSAFVIGTDKVNAQGFLADETAPDSVDEGDIGIARMTLDRKVLQVLVSSDNDARRLIIDASGFITSNINGTVTVDCNGSNVTVDNAGGAAAVNIQDGGNTITVDGTVAISGTVTVTATDLDIRDLVHTQDSVKVGDGVEFLLINTDGSINVKPAIVSSGSEVHDYDHAVNTGSGSSTNHDYAVVNTTFLCTGVLVSSSGRGRYEIQFGPVASLATIAVGFLGKDETKFIPFSPALPVPVASTGTLRVVKLNGQASAIDFYSTIMGEDI